MDVIRVLRAVLAGAVFASVAACSGGFQPHRDDCKKKPDVCFPLPSSTATP